jgi:hypothetical protein
MSARKTAPNVSHSPAGAALTQPCASIRELGARGLDYLGPERGLRRDSGGKLRVPARASTASGVESREARFDHGRQVGRYLANFRRIPKTFLARARGMSTTTREAGYANAIDHSVTTIRAAEPLQ